MLKTFKLTIAIGFSIALFIFNSGCSDKGKQYSQPISKPQVIESVMAPDWGEPVLQMYEDLLGKYLNQKNMVNYRAWTSSKQDLLKLRQIVSSMTNVDTSKISDQNELMAFYINAYNAMTLDLILMYYPQTLGQSLDPLPARRSIRNVKGTSPEQKNGLNWEVWDKITWPTKWPIALIKLEENKKAVVSLNEVEKKLLLPMGDARVHFALNCASLSCPPLSKNVFRATSLDKHLDELSYEFVNSGRDTSFDKENGHVYTSEIIKWYRADFIKSFQTQIEFFAKYIDVDKVGLSGEEIIKYCTKVVIDADTGVKTNKISNHCIKSKPYDWTLNETKESQ